MRKYPDVPNEGRITAFINGIQKYSTHFINATKRKHYCNNITALNRDKHVVLIFEREGEEPIEYFNSNNYTPRTERDYGWEYEEDGEIYFDADAFYQKHYKEENKIYNYKNCIQPITYKPSKNR